MELRRKFGFLALLYVLSLTATVAASWLCIIVYFRSAFAAFQNDFVREQQVEQLRALVRREGELFNSDQSPDDILMNHANIGLQTAALNAQMPEVMNSEPVSSQWATVQWAMSRQQEIVQKRLAALTEARNTAVAPAPLSEAELDAFIELDNRLAQVSETLNAARQTDVARAGEVEQRIEDILIASTICGGILTFIGVWCIRRWVLRPVAKLREATRQIGAGNFTYRVEPFSHDELGKLGEEVNQMASTIMNMQRKMVEQERLAAAGEMVARLVHNIRNPLASIRGLAETTAQTIQNDPETVECQRRIVDTIDRFERWLRQLQQSVSPLELTLHEVRIEDVIHHVVTALRPMLDRRRISVDVMVEPEVQVVQLDSMHFEQALVALLTNAVQASQAGQGVRVKVEAVPDRPGAWKLAVEDDGVGVPPEIRDRIFKPYFTTKSDGNGLGLAMANKVVKLHGGSLTVKSEVGKGSCFAAIMPGLIPDETLVVRK